MKQNIRLQLKNIELCKTNPRFKDVTLEINAKYIRNEQEISSQSEKDVMREIFSYEGDMEDFRILISLLANKIDSLLPKPIVLSIDNAKNYIVLEGNRRILALKLLNRLIKLPTLESIVFASNDEANNYVLNDNIDKKRQENFREIKRIINSYQANQLFELDVDEIINDKNLDTEVLLALFLNHEANKTEGKRNWNYSRKLSMINCFSNQCKTLDAKTINKISRIFGYQKNQTYKYINHALFVKNIIENTNENFENYLKLYPISKLTLDQIKSFINSSNDKKSDEIIKSIDDNQKIVFHDASNNSSKDFAQFAIHAHKNNLLDTKIKDLSDDKTLNYLYGVSTFDYSKKIDNKTSLRSIYNSPNSILKEITDEDQKDVFRNIKEIGSIKNELIKNYPLSKISDPKFYYIRRTLEKLRSELLVLFESDYNFDHLKIHGLCATTRCFSEVFNEILILSHEFRTELSCDKRMFSILLRNNRLTEEEFINIDEKLILNARLTDTSIIFDVARYIYSTNKTKIINILNGFLKSINANRLSNKTWDWFFSSSRYSIESTYIHQPQKFEVLKNIKSVVEFLKNNFNLTLSIINSIF